MPGYFPPASSGIALPAGTVGVADGLIGMEWDGDAYAVGALQWDTIYLDPATGDTSPLTGPVETDDFTFASTGVTVKADGLYATTCSVNLSGALTKQADGVMFDSGHLLGWAPRMIPAGARFGIQNGGIFGIRAGTVIAPRIQVHADDSALNVTFTWFGIIKIASATPLA